MGSTSSEGPESIEGYVDGAYSLPGLLDRIAQAEKFLDTMTICPGQMGQIAACLPHVTQQCDA